MNLFLSGEYIIFDSFYFLITQFQEISDFLAEKSYYPEMSLALYLDAGISAACIAAIIIICATYFAIGTTAFVKSMRAKKEIAMSKYVLMPALLTLALTLFLYSFASLSIAQEGAKAELTLGATTIVNIVLVSIAFATAAILQIMSSVPWLLGTSPKWARSPVRRQLKPCTPIWATRHLGLGQRISPPTRMSKSAAAVSPARRSHRNTRRALPSVCTMQTSMLRRRASTRQFTPQTAPPGISSMR